MKILSSLLLLTFLFLSHISFGQFVFNRFDNVRVQEDNKELLYPWAGGLNNPQFNEADLNNDGILDLVVFNRSNITQGDKILTFINDGTPGEVSYEYDPTYEEGFKDVGPDSLKLSRWILLRDMDCDGILDILSGALPGYINFYRGFYLQDMLTFKHNGYLKFNSNSGPVNIFASGLDVPAVVDMNFDGDLDIMTFGQFGTTMNYFENLSVETYGQCELNLLFEQIDDCWAHIVESGTKREVNIDTSCGFLKGGGNPRHSGTTLLGFDQGGDQDMDFVMGNISFPNLILVENGGDKDSAFVASQDTLYPSYDTSFDCNIFGVSFLADVNNDGLKDLLAAPNEPKRSQNLTCSWYYKNVGDSNNYIFEFVTDTFLIADMLDFGEGASPVFVDVNQDGKKDIISGNYGYFKSTVSMVSSLAYIQNVGTDSSFAFRLVERNFASIAQYRFNSAHPTFGDLDDDGDLDMLIGEEAGFLHYFENTAGAGNPLSFGAPVTRYASIDVGSYSTPFLFDADADGDLDLIVGERDGNINYFQNNGTASNPSFNSTEDNSFLGEVNVRLPGFFQGFSTPVISRLDTSDQLFLLSGSQQGLVKVYVFNRDSLLSGSFSLVYETFSGINEGENSSLSITDLNDDEFFEMVTGNYRGGLSFYSQTDSIQTPDTLINSTHFDFDRDDEKSLIHLFPNPANNSVYLSWDLALNSDKRALIQFYDSQGNVVYEEQQQNLSAKGQQQISLTGLPSGIYLVRFQTETQSSVVKLIKE